MRLTKVFQHDTAHDDGVWSTSWIADRDGFASGSVDESVKIWEGSGSDSDKGTLYTARHTYTGHTLGVISVASDATGKYMASSALDSIVRVWNVQTNQDVGVSVSSPTEVWSIAFGPTIDDTPTLAVAGGTRASVTYQSCNPAASQEDAESLALQEKANYQLPQVITERCTSKRVPLLDTLGTWWNPVGVLKLHLHCIAGGGQQEGALCHERGMEPRLQEAGVRRYGRHSGGLRCRVAQAALAAPGPPQARAVALLHARCASNSLHSLCGGSCQCARNTAAYQAQQPQQQQGQVVAHHAASPGIASIPAFLL